MSIETPFGSQQDPRIDKGCSCQTFLDSRPDLPSYGKAVKSVDEKHLKVARKQLTNFKGHSYLSRFLIFGVGGWVYKKEPQIVDFLMEELAANMRILFEEGVLLENGERFFGALVSIKGDLDFHEKYLRLTRSYSHLGSKNKIEICHLCKGGHRDFPFEDYAEAPAWASSASLLASRPWNENNRAPLTDIPYDANTPELMIGHDTFHVVKVGIGRDVIGGVLIFLVRKGFFDMVGSSSNLPDRLDRAHACFSLWCQVERHSPGLRSFSKSFFNIKNMMSAPWCSSKASDTRLLLIWIAWFLRLNIQNPVVAGHQQHLEHMLEVVQATLDINILHHHGLWLERPCAVRLYACMMTCLRGYSYLGKVALQQKIRSFIQKPKLHALHHIAYKIRTQLLNGAVVIASPQMLSCDVNEDFIGRISRLSRRVGFRLVDLRVIQRYYLKIAGLLRKQKRKSLHAKLAFSKAKARAVKK